MKLAMKYEMDSIRQRVIDVMRADWPMTYEQWARFRAELEVMKRAHNISPDGRVDGKDLHERIPEPASAARFARDFDIPSILPAAYYTLATTSRNCNWDKWGRGLTYFRSARWGLLDGYDYKIVMCLRELLTGKLSNVAFEYSGRSSGYAQSPIRMDPRCRSREECSTALTGLLKQWKKNDLDLGKMLAASSTPDPIRVMETLYQSHPAWGLCHDCTVYLQKHI